MQVLAATHTKLLPGHSVPNTCLRAAIIWVARRAAYMMAAIYLIIVASVEIS